MILKYEDIYLKLIFTGTYIADPEVVMIEKYLQIRPVKIHSLAETKITVIKSIISQC